MSQWLISILSASLSLGIRFVIVVGLLFLFLRLSSVGDIRITFLTHPCLMSLTAYEFNHQDVIGISTVFNSFPEFDGFYLAAVFALMGF